MKHVKPITAIFIWFVAVFSVMGLVFYQIKRYEENKQYEYLKIMGSQPDAPTCLKMYSCIEKYSRIHGVPKHIAYNVAYMETGYRGPFHWSYTTKHKSSAAAVGPMQIITKYSYPYAGRIVSEDELMNSVELNVSVSMKMLKEWFRISKNWTIACGAYNSGQLIVNDYANYCSTTKDYKSKWLKPKD